jgi:hypothetical protein
MKKTPLALVRERHTNKEQLVAAVQALATEELWIDRVNETKGLGRVSNAKLAKLHRCLSDAKQRFGSRAKLIDSILELEKRAKDAGFRARLESYPIPRLLDVHQATERRAKRAQSKPAKPAKARGAEKS